MSDQGSLTPPATAEEWLSRHGSTAASGAPATAQDWLEKHGPDAGPDARIAAEFGLDKVAPEARLSKLDRELKKKRNALGKPSNGGGYFEQFKDLPEAAMRRLEPGGRAFQDFFEKPLRSDTQAALDDLRARSRGEPPTTGFAANLNRFGAALQAPLAVPTGLKDLVLGQPMREAPAPSFLGKTGQAVRQIGRQGVDALMFGPGGFAMEPLGEVTSAGAQLPPVRRLAEQALGGGGPEALGNVANILAGARMLHAGMPRGSAAARPLAETYRFPTMEERVGRTVPGRMAPRLSEGMPPAPVEGARQPYVRPVPALPYPSTPGVMVSRLPQYGRPIGPPVPSEGLSSYAVTARTGHWSPLERAVRKAGFKDLRAAVEAVQRGDETGLQALRPEHVDQVVEIANRVKDVRIGDRLSRQAVDRAVPEKQIPQSKGGVTLGSGLGGMGEFGTEALQRAGQITKDAVAGAADRIRAAAEDYRRRGDEYGHAIADAMDRVLAGHDPVAVTQDLIAAHKEDASYGLKEYAGRTTGHEYAEQFASNLLNAVNGRGPARESMNTMGMNLGNAGELLKGGGKTLHNWIRTNLDTLKRYGPAGEELRDLTDRAIGLRNNLAGKWRDEFDVAWRSMSSKDRKILDDGRTGWAILEGRKEPTSPQMQAVVDQWRQIHPEVRDTATASGVRVDLGNGKWREIGRNPNYTPMAPEPMEGHKPSGPSLREFYEKNVGPDKSFPDEAAANDYLQHYDSHALKSTYPGLERPRRVILPDSMRRKSVYEGISNYLERAAGSIAEHEMYDYRNKQTGEPVNAGYGNRDIQGKLGHLLKQIGGTNADAAEKTVLRLLRRLPSDMAEGGRGIRNFNALEGTVQAARLYTRPSSAVVQMSQFPMLVAQQGMPALQGLARAVGSPREMYRLGKRSGAQNPILRFASTVGLENDPIGRTATAATKATNWLTSPMGAVDAFNRTVAVASAEPFAAKLTRHLKAGGQRARAATQALKSMNFGAEEIARFKAGEQTAADMVRLRQKIVRNTQGEATTAERIPAAATPGAHTFFRGKNFNISQARNTGRVALDQAKVGNPMPALRLAGTGIPLGYGMLKAIQAMTGKGDERGEPFFEHAINPDDSVDIGELARAAARYANKASIGGIIGDIAYSLVPDNKGHIRFKTALDRAFKSWQIYDLTTTGQLPTVTEWENIIKHGIDLAGGFDAAPSRPFHKKTILK